MQLVNRRMFLVRASALLAACTGLTHAASLPQIIILSISAPKDQMQAFEEGLQDLGLINGLTVNLTHFTTGGSRNSLPRVADEAVSASPDVIVAVGGKAAVAAHASTKDIPIVAVTGDMNSVGLVKNFSQPEGNVTGFSFFTLELGAKRLQLLLEVNPSLRRLVILLPTGRHRAHEKAVSILNESLAGKEITAEVVDVSNVDDIEAIIASIDSKPEESLYILPSVEFDAKAEEIGGIISKHKVIAMLPWKEYVEAGGLMSYSPDIVAIWREASTYVDRILRGALPSELPVTLSTRFELVINLRAAQDLGLFVPTHILLRADRIIE